METWNYYEQWNATIIANREAQIQARKQIQQLEKHIENLERESDFLRKAIEGTKKGES